MVFGHIEHVLRAVLFERSGDARSFYLSVFFQPLYVPAKFIHLTFGRRLPAWGWNADDPALLEELTAVIRKEAVPFLNSVGTIEGVLDYLENAAKEAPNNEHIHQTIVYTLALAGNTTAAGDQLDRLLELINISIEYWQQQMATRFRTLKKPLNRFWEKEMAAEAQLLKKLLDNPVEARNQLMQWEADTVRNLGLEELWQA